MAVISTRKHLDYALGYLELNLFAEARAELDLITAADQKSAAVLAVKVEVAMAGQAWKRVVTLAPQAVEAAPTEERPWVAWAYALRELQRIADARDVLLRAERTVPKPGVIIDYNLACYFCLLGDLPEARRRLKRVLASEPSWADEAKADPDLAALR